MTLCGVNPHKKILILFNALHVSLGILNVFFWFHRCRKPFLHTPSLCHRWDISDKRLRHVSRYFLRKHTTLLQPWRQQPEHTSHGDHSQTGGGRRTLWKTSQNASNWHRAQQWGVYPPQQHRNRLTRQQKPRTPDLRWGVDTGPVFKSEGSVCEFQGCKWSTFLSSHINAAELSS